MPLTAGTILGPYVILSPLGAGGMGEVYRARDTRLGRDVALKVLKDQVASHSRARFDREVRAASALTHPHICAVYDVGEADDHLFFVMELVEGTTLRDYVRERPLDPSEVIAIGVQIADALAVAHSKGIVHRDIKPGNIMITSRRHVKVLDFGLALQVAEPEDVTMERLTKAGTVMGTVHYMSPELLQGGNADARSDVWALGVVLYELLTGRPPFKGSTAFEVSADILRESAPPLPQGVPAGLRSIVDRCLKRQPDARYQHAGDVRTVLDTLQTPASVRPAASSRRWIAWGSAALAAGAVIVGLTVLRPGSDLPHKRTSTGAPASTNQEANEAFELAMNFQRVQNNLARSQPLLERAIALDPHFAEALRYHAVNNVFGLLNGFTNDTSELYKAEEELRQVAQEAPSLVSLPSALTMLYLMQGRPELVPTGDLERVLTENPSHRDTLFWKAILAWLDGDNAAVRRLTTGILEREPLWGPPRTFLGDVLRTEGDVQGAIREQLKVLEQAPDNISAIRFLVHAYMDAGEPESAQRLLESKRAAYAKNYLWRLTWALLMARGNQRAEALATLDEETLKFAGATFVVTLDAAECYALLGDVSRAVEWVDRAVRNGDERLDWFRRNPRLAEIREDPRFQRIIESVETRQKTRKRS